LDKAIKILSDNRRASHNYFLLERFEAGMALTGTEVKSARDGKIQLMDSYAEVRGREAWLVNAHISHYSHGNRENHDPVRDRKLLLHRREIARLLGRAVERGLTIIPLRVYLERGYAKVELALARGRRQWDKRRAIAEREARREEERALSPRRRKGEHGSL